MTASDMPNTLSFLEFSQLSYDLTSTSGLATVPLPSGFSVLSRSSPYESGLTAVAFINKNTNQIVISYRGSTQSNTTEIYNDWIDADFAHIVLGRTPQAFLDALNFAKTVIASNPNSQIYVTGHSLGGAEAEYVAANDKLGGMTFAAPGIANILPKGVSVDDNSLTDYVNQYDPIGNYTASILGVGPGKHVGNVISLSASLSYSAEYALGIIAYGPVMGSAVDIGAAAATFHPLGSYGAALLAGGYIGINPIGKSQSEQVDLSLLYPSIQNVVNGSDVNGNFTQTGTVPVVTAAGIINFVVEEIASPSGGISFISAIKDNTYNVSEDETINLQGVQTVDNVMVNGLNIKTSISDPLGINIDRQGDIIIGVPAQDKQQEVTVVANQNGSESVMVGGGVISPASTALIISSVGDNGDTLTFQDNGANVGITLGVQDGTSVEVEGGTTIADVSDDIYFLGTNSTLKIDSAGAQFGVISNFQVGDTIDLADIGAPTCATLGAYDVLTVQGSDATGTVNLDPTQDYSSESFLIAPDGEGGTSITAESDDQPIAFTGTGETLLVVDPGSLTGVISGFGDFNTIDLVGIGGPTSATLGANDVLTVQGVGAPLP